MAPTLSHQGCSTADQGPGLGPSYLQSGLGGTGIAHHGNSRANVNNVLARNKQRSGRAVIAAIPPYAGLATMVRCRPETLLSSPGSGSSALPSGQVAAPVRHSIRHGTPSGK